MLAQGNQPGRQLAVGIHPYPLGVAFRLVKRILERLERFRPPTWGELRRASRKAAAPMPDYPAPEWRWLEPLPGVLPMFPPEQWSLLSGRMLSGMEIGSVLNSLNRASVVDLEKYLHGEVLAGHVQRLPGIDRDALERAVCSRCGEKEQLIEVDCAYCGGRCFICHSCSSLGSVRECIPIYRFASQPLEEKISSVELRMHPLSPIQQRASRQLADFFHQDIGEAFLVWAVCGAGKTELVFETIRQAILTGTRVLYAVPRREVVLEIGKRLEYAFPGVPIAVLVGGEGKKTEPYAAITVATTHQVLRFYGHFPLAILDEADAYPYEGSRMLRFGLERAVSPGGKLIYLTATPTRELRNLYREGKIEGVQIPGRHHGHPLPVPELWGEKIPKPGTRPVSEKHPPRLVAWLLESIGEKAPVMLFLPTVAMVEYYGPIIAKLGEVYGFRTGWVHASHPARDATVSEFRQGQIEVLMTTTVMERGLNFPGVHVLVLHAEREDIFDVESLVQIAGRAGRYPSHPKGRVVFWGERVTRAMNEAREWIIAMNRQAEQDGLLVVSGYPEASEGAENRERTLAKPHSTRDDKASGR